MTELPEPYKYGVSLRVFEKRIGVFEDDEPSRFFQDWGGAIELERDPDDGSQEIIGSFALRFIDLGAAMNARESFFEVFDTHSSTMDLYAALYDSETGDLREQVSKLAFGKE